MGLHGEHERLRFLEAPFLRSDVLTQSNKLPVFASQANPFAMREHFIVAIRQSARCRIHNVVVGECRWNRRVVIERALCRSNPAFDSLSLTDEYAAKDNHFFHDCLPDSVFQVGTRGYPEESN